jgi:hypothetical protein
MNAPIRGLAAIAFLAAFAALPAMAVQRVFVSSKGSDANTATSCGFNNPCRGFTAALTVVDNGGEIVALDAAGYGQVIITKSVTITANPGVYAGISASSGNAVTINGGGLEVTLRDLKINGLGADRGISMTAGASLTIENCVISNFLNYGVYVSTPAPVRILNTNVSGGVDGVFVQGGAILDIARSTFRDADQAGVHVNGDIAATTTNGTIVDSVSTGNAVGYFASSGSTGIARMAVSRSAAANNYGFGVFVLTSSATTALATVSGSTVTNNLDGLRNDGGTLESRGDNTVRQNVNNTAGTITTVPGI